MHVHTLYRVVRHLTIICVGEENEQGERRHKNKLDGMFGLRPESHQFTDTGNQTRHFTGLYVKPDVLINFF